MIRWIQLSLLFVLLNVSVAVNAVEWNKDHPQTYQVVVGDTLWDIAEKFISDPWQWSKIVAPNPEINDPQLIYPGDVLQVADCAGKPCVKLTRGVTTTKLSPQIRETTLDKSIATIPLAVINPFLLQPRVLGAEVLATAPYVVASSQERLISGAGDKVYVRGITSDSNKHYAIFRKGSAYSDPETGEALGYEAIYIADAWLDKGGDPATVELYKTTQEVMIGDRLLAATASDIELTFIPRTPSDKVDGRILSVFGGVSQVGQYQIIALNRGERENLQPGHVLAIYQAGDTMRDGVIAELQQQDYFNLDKMAKEKNATITLPDEHAGVAMVFRSYEKISYAIIMKATRAIHVGDRVTEIYP